jgi:hypothetical protein
MGIAKPARATMGRETMGSYGERKETSMRGKLLFGAGVGLGYLLGTRAGRERFDQIAEKAKQFWESDKVQEAAGMVQSRAGRIYEGGKNMVSEQANRMRATKSNPQRPQTEGSEESEHHEPWEAPVGFPVTTSY